MDNPKNHENHTPDFEKLQEVIHYNFQNKQLLYQAMTHSSYTFEHHQTRFHNNERLEFLGDAVLELTSSEYLFIQYPQKPEGELTRLRASLVCEPTLAACARDISLGDYLMLGKGESYSGGRFRDSMTSDALEALIGAIYLDGGLTNAKEFIERFILNDIENKQLFYDSKTILQELVQGHMSEKLSYVLIKEEGPAHNKVFTVNALLGTKVIGTGSGPTKKRAEQTAAYEAICSLKKKGVTPCI